MNNHGIGKLGRFSTCARWTLFTRKIERLHGIFKKVDLMKRHQNQVKVGVYNDWGRTFAYWNQLKEILSTRVCMIMYITMPFSEYLSGKYWIILD